eukprot:767769-Hanusia_phi.AAC.5
MKKHACMIPETFTVFMSEFLIRYISPFTKCQVPSIDLGGREKQDKERGGRRGSRENQGGRDVEGGREFEEGDVEEKGGEEGGREGRGYGGEDGGQGERVEDMTAGGRTGGRIGERRAERMELMGKRKAAEEVKEGEKAGFLQGRMEQDQNLSTSNNRFGKVW